MIQKAHASYIVDVTSMYLSYVATFHKRANTAHSGGMETQWIEDGSLISPIAR